jgi:cell division protein FtsW (lipid II flippase)
MGGHKHAFPGFITSTAILLFYWAIFRVSYIVRKCDDRQEKVSTVAAPLNSAALLGLMKYQSIHPKWAFWALLAMGTVELGLALLPITRRRRAAFLILATIGVTLLVAAVPLRFTGARLDALWLVEAEALILAGYYLALAGGTMPFIRRYSTI